MKKLFALILLLFLSSSLYAQKSNFGLGINLGTSVPTGDFDKFYKTGFGGDAHFLYHLGNQTIFSLSVGYNVWNLDVDELNMKVADAGLTWTLDLDSEFKSIPILIGVKWILAQNKKGGLYVSLLGGVYNYTFTLKGTANRTGYNINMIKIEDIEESGTETMLALGLGYLFKFGKHWYVDVKGNYNIITNAFTLNEPVNPEDPEAIYGVKGTLQYVSFLAGINYRF
jgi:hypothetical protein